MVKHYWSSILLVTITQKQTAWARKTWSQHQLWSFMPGCERLSCSSQASISWEVAKQLTEFLVVFQIDKPIAPFLTETLEDLIKTLMRKFIQKDLHDKSCSEMAKLDFNNVNNQRPTFLVDLIFAVNHEIQLLNSSKKITDSQILKCKKEAAGLLVALCTYLMEKCPAKSFFCQMSLLFISKLYHRVFWDLWEIVS